MSIHPWRDALAEYIWSEARPREKYGHQPRLYALTLKIGEGLAYDDDIVYAAAWLHDLGVFTGHRPEDPDALAHWDHVIYTVERTPALLKSFGFPEEKIDGVIECIRNHQPRDTPETIESTILRDADILEQLGAIGIMRTVCKVARDTRFITFSDAAASLQKAVDTLPALLKLPSSQRLAQERISTHRLFLAALDAEADGRLV